MTGGQSFIREYPVVRKCCTSAQINGFRSVFSLARTVCVCVSDQIRCMGELQFEYVSANYPLLVLDCRRGLLLKLVANPESSCLCH